MEQELWAGVVCYVLVAVEERKLNNTILLAIFCPHLTTHDSFFVLFFYFKKPFEKGTTHAHRPIG